MGILLGLGNLDIKRRPLYSILCPYLSSLQPSVVRDGSGHGSGVVCNNLRTLHPRVVLPDLSSICPDILCHNQFRTSPVMVCSNL